jgi:hypothetical protein
VLFISFGNAFNNENDEGLLDIQLNFGLNLGIGNDINIDFK